jgi:hypothetical protein
MLLHQYFFNNLDHSLKTFIKLCRFSYLLKKSLIQWQKYYYNFSFFLFIKEVLNSMAKVLLSFYQKIILTQ